MCGGGGDQTVTQKTELDPELMRLLYGGSIVGGKRYAFGQAPDPNAPQQPTAMSSGVRDGSYGPDVGGFGGGSMDGFGGSAPSQGGFGGSMSDHVGSGGMYAMGGPVQSGIASMQPNMPMTQNMPMMNGMLPNLSDPEIAATLAMAQMRPQMMMGMGSGGMPQQAFAAGGSVLTADVFPEHIQQKYPEKLLRVLSAGVGGRYGLEALQRQEQSAVETPPEQSATVPTQQGPLQAPVDPRLVSQLVQRGQGQYFNTDPNSLAGAGMPQLPTLEIGGRPMQFAMGGYVEGPGTGTSDDIPATIFQDGMPVQNAALSDGEFVMTERAVRNAGGGDRDRGAARMYEMMRMFEQGGRV